MKPIIFPVLLASALLVAGCRGGLTEEKVRKSGSRSLEITQSYIRQQRDYYEKALQKRIGELDKNIGQLRDVSADNSKSVGGDLNTPIGKLQAERDGLAARLESLRKTSDAEYKRAEDNWNRYNAGTDSILNEVRNYHADYGLPDSTRKQ